MQMQRFGSRSTALWLLLSIIVFLASGIASAQESVDAGLAENSTRWFVELKSPPTADGGSLSADLADKQAFRQAAKAAGLSYRELRSFNVLFNGFSIDIAARDLSKLSQMPGVKDIYPVVAVQPDLATAITMTGADIAQNTLGFTGAGVKVGVIDTGIDYTHPDLGNDCFGSGCRVVGGWDFVGDAYDSSNVNPAKWVPHPDDDPMDCAGHGTHVAGIIGANGAVKGVAPDASLYAYRVFGCSGTTDSDIMIAAMERALGDGVQVINMSIGSAFQWPQYPSAAAATRLVNMGVVVVASIGNSGANGLYAAGAPGVGAKVIGVASYDNIAVRQPAFSITGGTLFGYNSATGAPAAPTSGSLPMAKTGTTSSGADACSALPAGSLSGKAALIRRGGCTFYVKSANAQSAGASAVVLYNNIAGFLSPTVAPTAPDPAITIPVVAVTAAAGATIDAAIAAGAVDLTWTTQMVSTPDTVNGGLISSFSSYGLSPDLTLKPDIGAPGGNIYSTWPVDLGSYAVLSGTSMSSPHVAGTVALLLQAKPKTSAQSVRSILQNSALPKNWSGNPGLGFLDNVQRQGAGMVQIDKAILSNVSIEPGKLSLGENSGTPVTYTLTLRNAGSDTMTYALGHVRALATTNNTFSPSAATHSTTASFSQSGVPVTSVTVGPLGTATVDVTILPSSSTNRMFGGYLVFTADTQTLRVPYAGFFGDYQSIQVLTPTTNGFPWVAQLSGGSYWKVSESGATFTMAGADVPYILLHLNHQSRRLKAEAFDAVSGKSYHVVLNWEYNGRNSTATGFYALPWDGTTYAGNKMYQVPDGTYMLKVTVEKALSDGTPASFETWTSPAFTIHQ